MIKTLEIELLRTFHMVARYGKFRAAAELLHKSPAAVSVHIQRLEAVAGGRLFDRDNQAVTLTTLGQRLLESTQPLLAAHDRVLDELNGCEASGKVILGVPDDYVIQVVEDILPIFSKGWPSIDLEIRTAPSNTLHAEVAKAKIDLAVIAQASDRDNPSEDRLQLTTPVWVGALGYTFVLDKALPVALPPEGCPYRTLMTRLLTEAGINWRPLLETSSTHAIKSCVEASNAVTVLDRSRTTNKMQILEHLPPLPPHELVIVRAIAEEQNCRDATAVLADVIKQRFKV